MHCCLIGHRQINVVQNCPAANLTLSAQVCSCPHGGPWKAIVTVERNRLASCLRSHSLISLARLSAKQRSASGPWLNAGSTPCIYQTTRYASTNGSGKQPKPLRAPLTLTSQQLVWCLTPSPKMTREFYILSYTVYRKFVTKLMEYNQSMPVSSSLPLIEDQDLWVPNPSRVWSLWRWRHSTSVTLRRHGATRRFMKWRCNGAIYRCLVWESPKLSKLHLQPIWNVPQVGRKKRQKSAKNPIWWQFHRKELLQLRTYSTPIFVEDFLQGFQKSLARQKRPVETQGNILEPTFWNCENHQLWDTSQIFWMHSSCFNTVFGQRMKKRFLEIHHALAMASLRRHSEQSTTRGLLRSWAQ